MALSLDTLTSTLSAAAKAAGQAASAGGKDITGDVEKFVIPQMQGIASQIAAAVNGALGFVLI